MQSVNYQVRDIVVATPEFACRKFLILEITDFGYYGMDMNSKNRYPLFPKHLAQKIGELNEGDPLLSLYKDEFNAEEAHVFCVQQANANPNDAMYWKVLQGLKPGDPIHLVHRKMIYPAEFIKINTEKPVYPIRAKIKGLAKDFKLVSLVLNATAENH